MLKKVVTQVVIHIDTHKRANRRLILAKQTPNLEVSKVIEILNINNLRTDFACRLDQLYTKKINRTNKLLLFIRLNLLYIYTLRGSVFLLVEEVIYFKISATYTFKFANRQVYLAMKDGETLIAERVKTGKNE